MSTVQLSKPVTRGETEITQVTLSEVAAESSPSNDRAITSSSTSPP